MNYEIEEHIRARREEVNRQFRESREEKKQSLIELMRSIGISDGQINAVLRSELHVFKPAA